MRLSLTWAIALAVVLSGCANAPETDENATAPDPGGHNTDDISDESPDESPDESHDQEMEEPEPVANSPPVPAIDVAAEAVLGVEVTVNLTATDPEGDALEWTLLLDGDEVGKGSLLPAQHTHTFDAIGEYRFTLNVTDGTVVASVTADVVVVEPTPVLTIAGTTTITGSPASSGVVSGDVPGAGAKACTGFLRGENEVDCVYGAVPADLEGRPYTFAGEGSNPDHEFLASCEPDAEVVQGYADTGEEGDVPAGAGCVVMWFFSSTEGPLRLDVF